MGDLIPGTDDPLDLLNQRLRAAQAMPAASVSPIGVPPIGGAPQFAAPQFSPQGVQPGNLAGTPSPSLMAAAPVAPIVAQPTTPQPAAVSTAPPTDPNAMPAAAVAPIVSTPGPAAQKLAADIKAGEPAAQKRSGWRTVLGAGLTNLAGPEATQKFLDAPQTKADKDYASLIAGDTSNAAAERQTQEDTRQQGIDALAAKNVQSEIDDRKAQADERARAKPAPDSKTVDTGTGVFQYNDDTGRYDIKVGDSKAPAQSFEEQTYAEWATAQKAAGKPSDRLTFDRTLHPPTPTPTEEDAKGAAEDILAHRLAPSEMASIYGGFGAAAQQFKRMVIAQARKIDPNFNYEEAESEYQFSKSAGFQNATRYMDSVQESMPLLLDRAKKLANGDVRSINALVNAGKGEFNSVDLKQFNTDRLLVADEVAKIMQGGGTGSATSDTKLNQAAELLKSTDSPAAIAGALADIKTLISYRRTALTRGTYMDKSAAAPGAPKYDHTATDKNGNQVGWDGKQWQPIPKPQ